VEDEEDDDDDDEDEEELVDCKTGEALAARICVQYW
jgi:hypothetical protein